MNFALLGNSSLIDQFESQLADSKIHRRVYASPDLRRIDPTTLEQSGADVVIFDGQDEEVVLLNALQNLTGFRGAVFISPLCSRTVLTAYEFERLAGETVGFFIPLLPLLQHECLQSLIDNVTDAKVPSLTAVVGQLESIDLQRPLSQVDSGAVVDALTIDLPILVHFVGSIKEVVAMRTGSEPIPLNVQCTSESGRLVRWSAVRAGPEQEAAQLLIEGTIGRVRIRLKEAGDWDLEIGNQEISFPPMDLLAICNAVASGQESYWSVFTHCLEVREAVEKSLQRGRLVRINLDGHGERTAFMGTMASLGCALLLGTIFVLVFSAAILSLVPENRFGRLSVWIEKVPWILAAIMILFLLVQFLAFVIPRRTED